jgi:hypothetical protein
MLENGHIAEWYKNAGQILFGSSEIWMILAHFFDYFCSCMIDIQQNSYRKIVWMVLKIDLFNKVFVYL